VPTAPRHAKRSKTATRRWAPAAAGVMLAGVTAAFMFLHTGSGAPKPSHDTSAAMTSERPAAPSAASDVAVAFQMTTARRDVAALASRKVAQGRRLAQRRHAARLAQRQAALQAATPSPAPSSSPSQTASPAPSPSASPPPSSGGGDAASSPLGVCIRNAEEGGSYAWGAGNGGGAYQFALGTWETYGGAASEFGVAGPAYQDQIFDNAIAAGGASNWTTYDGC
jgi:hypothetical protein